uniref:Pentatricopeptide repeat-containing protein n=1 Tax=Rhizophora mucronata TaxID=61149 RepID=A0A2P2NYM1_RHIMU
MLEEYEVEPVTDHHVCVVDMLGRSGRLHEAFDFIKQMQSLPEPGVWGALLSACSYHGEIELGREVAELLFAVDSQNSGYYISLSNMYSAAGVWKEAVELRNIVEDKQLKKPAAYSLIDVGS